MRRIKRRYPDTLDQILTEGTGQDGPHPDETGARAGQQRITSTTQPDQPPGPQIGSSDQQPTERNP